MKSATADSRVAALVAGHRRFLAFLTWRVASRQDAEDILQAAFVKAIEKADTVRDAESTVAWFYRLLRNALLDHRRRRARGERALAARGRQTSFETAAGDAELERMACACVAELLPQLRPGHAELLRRVDLGGAQVAAAARSLGLTPGNARVRLHRARAALRRQVERVCRTCATHGCLDCSCRR